MLLPGMSLLCAGTSPDVHGGLGIQRSSWRESKRKKPKKKKSKIEKAVWPCQSIFLLAFSSLAIA